MARPLYDRRAAMRDGVELSTDVFLPDDGPGPWPAILVRTPYDNSAAEYVAWGTYYASHGYAFVSQDVRGRGDSDGRFYPFWQEGPDGHDSIEWVAAQSWCNGRVGTMGGSYAGVVQWLAARERPAHLKAIASTAAPGRWMEELPYLFGTYSSHWIGFLNVTSGRTLQHPVFAPRPPVPDFPSLRVHRPFRDIPLKLGRDLPVWKEWLEHNTYDAYWRRLSLENDFATLDMPALHVTGWFDYNQRGELYYWEGMKASPARDQQWLIVGPWDHAGTRHPVQHLGVRDFGADSLIDLNEAHRRFFDHVLKEMGNGFDAGNRVKIFAMGVNHWQTHADWLVPQAQAQRFYLRSGGSANTASGDGTLSIEPPGRESNDSYVYDPDDPTPSFPSIADQDLKHRGLENGWRLGRADTLVYTSAPLEAPLHITGVPLLALFAASNRIDTDWHAQICEVAADGTSEELAIASLRAAYRAGRYIDPTPITPGDVIEYRLEFTALDNVCQPGVRLRLCIASADYPRRTQNPNTNAPTGDDEIGLPATNTVYHDSIWPSHLLLSVLP